MKYIVILGDGMPDYVLKELEGRTPLQFANTPNMDLLATGGEFGMVKNVPEGMPAGSDVANLSVFGYDPGRYYTGRSPLEAAAMGIEMAAGDVSFRCNLVTLSEHEPYERKIMLDYSSDEISTEEARELMEEVSERLGSAFLNFYAGMSYRHLMIWKDGPADFQLTPPHDITGREIGDHLPRGAHNKVLLDLMLKSAAFLGKHEVNRKRVERGLRPANSIWLWGEGRKPYLDSFRDKYGLEGSVISAVDLIKGIGMLAGLDVAVVPGATGNLDTDYRAKAQIALQELHAGKDFVYIHIEAPDEAGHRGELKNKIRAIEEIDEKVVGEMLRGLEKFPDYRIMVLADHPTPLSLLTHTGEAVPFCIYQKSSGEPGKGKRKFCEKNMVGGLYFTEGFKLMDYFLQKEAM